MPDDVEDTFLPSFFEVTDGGTGGGSGGSNNPPPQEQQHSGVTITFAPMTVNGISNEEAQNNAPEEPDVDEALLTPEELLELRANRLVPGLGLGELCTCTRCLGTTNTENVTIVLTPPKMDLTGTICRQVETICKSCWDKMHMAVEKKEMPKPEDSEWNLI